MWWLTDKPVCCQLLLLHLQVSHLHFEMNRLSEMTRMFQGKSLAFNKTVYADDPVDAKTGIDESCGDHHCAALKLALDTCTERVTGNPASGETCTQELFDFLHCVDHCVSGFLFLIHY